MSMADMHQAAMQWTVTPENWSGRVEMISALDGRVTNRGVTRYRSLEGRHLDPVSPRTFGPEIIALEVRTRQSRIYVAEAARTRVYDEGPLDVDRRPLPDAGLHPPGALLRGQGEGARAHREDGRLLHLARPAINEPLVNAGKAVSRYGTFAEAFERHARAWDELWDVCDVRVPKDDRVQLLLRLHISHILRSARRTPPTSTRASRPAASTARPTADIFWDELFIYPSSTSGCRR